PATATMADSRTASSQATCRSTSSRNVSRSSRDNTAGSSEVSTPNDDADGPHASNTASHCPTEESATESTSMSSNGSSTKTTDGSNMCSAYLLECSRLVRWVAGI